MNLVTFVQGGSTRIGLLEKAPGTGQTGGQVVDLRESVADFPSNMQALIHQGDALLEKISDVVKRANTRLPLADVKLLAPIPVPARNIFCVGKNYPDHVSEIKSVTASPSDTIGEVPDYPIIFTKLTSSVTGPGDPIPSNLDYTDSVDYEGELGVIIGKGGRNISREHAMRHIFGYTIINDVTSRRLQRMHQQWFIGKSLDGFCPMGPCIVTSDEISDVSTLRIQTRVNNELRQDGYVSEMIFDIPMLIETLSRTMTLESGDIIATGTPAGVGMGFKPPRFLKKGDVVSITIDPIGTLTNPVN